jgi:N-acetylmuramoyl-L-alanine amidase
MPRAVIAGALSAAVAVVGGYAIAAGQDSKDDCRDATHATAEAGTWEEAAKGITESRGYSVTVARLLQANGLSGDSDPKSKVVKGDKSGEDACLDVPAPVVGNQYVAEKGQTLADIARVSGVDAKELLKLNPGVEKPGKGIQPGTVVWLNKKADTKLVLQPFDGDLKKITGGDGKKVREILLANVALFSDAVEMKEGQLRYLPAAQPPTEEMKKMGLTVDKIIKEEPKKYKYETRELPKPEPEPSASAPSSPSSPPTPSAEASAAPAELHLSAAQIAAIEAMDLSPEKKAFLRDISESLMQIAPEMIKNGMRPDVTLAQALLETNYGSDNKLVQYHNYFGMKADSRWKGAKTPDVPTGEQIENGGHVQIYTKFRAYDTMTDGVRGYMENIMSKYWYDDMRQWPDDLDKYLDGLLNTLASDGTIAVAHELAYATDDNSDGDGGYDGKIRHIISQYGLSELFKDYKASAPSAPVETQAPPTGKRNIKLDRSKYEPDDKNFWVNKSKGAYVTIGGEKVLLRDLDTSMRLKLVEAALNNVEVSAEGYADFLQRYKDISQQVKDAKWLTNFDGKKNGLGTPKPGGIKYYIWHYTATDVSASGYDGMKAASSMQNGGRGVGSVFYVNNVGGPYRLTHDNVLHVPNHNRGDAVGMEIAASGQETITTQQYQDGIYLTANYLIENGYVKDVASAKNVVNTMVRGHGEMNPELEDRHNDNVKMVMDQVRPMIIEAITKILASK